MRLFDTISSSDPNLVDFESSVIILAEENWFRFCHIPLERFAVEKLLDANATLATLENFGKNSLQTIQVGFSYTKTSFELSRRKFSTFRQLHDVSLNTAGYSHLENQTVLLDLEKLCLHATYETDRHD